MKINKILPLLALVFAIGCNNDDLTTAGSSYDVEFLSSTRVSGTNFENGDNISICAFSNGAQYDQSTYTYSSTGQLFSNPSDPISKMTEEQELSYYATYPAVGNIGAAFGYSVFADQSVGSNYELSDMLVSSAENSTSMTPQLSFYHKMSSMILYLTGASNPSVTISAKRTAMCDVVGDAYAATGSASDITPAANGASSFKAVLAPQQINANELFITVVSGGKTFTYELDKAFRFESGKQYQFTCNCTNGSITFNGVVVSWGKETLVAETAHAAWPELPAEIEKSGDYYYMYHEVNLVDGTKSRKSHNYGACYSDKFQAPIWVAGPYHRVYRYGSGDRKNNYRRDPDYKGSKQTETAGSPYNRGHMIASSDRLNTQDMNNQAFYCTNIGPQLISGFNSGGGIWNNYEDWMQDVYSSRSDTMYVVNGAHWANTNKKHSGVTIPTHYYKAVLRCKTKNSTKSVLDCSRSELECAAFYFEHKSQPGVKPSAKHIITIDKLEEITGWDFFANVPNAPEDVAKASDWGL